MSTGNPVSRTVSIYIDQAAAEQAAERLTKKVQSLETAIRKGEAAGKDMTAKIAQLGQARDQLNQVEGIMSGRMTPTIRQMSAHVTKLRNELLNMSRDAPGYAAKFEAFKAASVRLHELEKDLRSVEAAMKQADNPGFWARMKDGLVQGLGIAGGLNVAGWIQKGLQALKNFAVGAADAAAQMEALRVAYTTLLGSQSKADEMIRSLQQFSKATPFEFEEVAGLTKQLLAYGFQQKEIIPTLERLGNVASGVGKEKLPQLMLAFGQVRAAGRLMGQELLQFVNAGFNPLIQMSEKTGKSMRALRKDMADGKISFDMVQEAFISATSEGGKFFNLMNNQNKTTSGALAALKDGWQQFKTIVGEAANGPLRLAYLTLGKIVNTMTEWVSLNPQQQIAKEKDELNGLVYALISANDNQALKSQIMSEIKQKYPQFLSFVDAETASVADLGRALEVVNQQYDHKIRLAALDQRQQKNSDNRLDLQNNYLDAQQKLADRLKLDVVELAKMTKEERLALIQQRVKDELAKSKDRDWMDKILSGAGGSEGSRGTKIRDEAQLKAFMKLEEDFATKQKALDDERLTTTKLITVENERQQKQDETALANAKARVKELEKNKATLIAAGTKLLGFPKIAQESYQAELAQAKKLVEGLEQTLHPVDAVTKPGEDPVDPKALKAAQKAEREHAKAVKDVADLQFKLDQLKDEIKAASLDADAGFQDKANAELQKVATKYAKLIKEVKDRIMRAAGLTDTEKAALNNMIQEYTKLQLQESEIVKARTEKEADEDSYKKELQIIADYYNKQRQLAGEQYAAGEISKEAYKNQLLAIDKEEGEMRVDTITSFAPFVKKATEDLEKAKTDATKKGIAERDALLLQQQHREEARLQLNLAKAKKGTEQELDAKIALLKQRYDKERELQKGNGDAIKVLDEQQHQEQLLLEKEFWQQRADIIANALNGITQVFSAFMNYLNKGDEAQLSKEQNDNDKKKKGYQQMLDHKQITQEQYNKLVADADAEMEKKEIEAKKREAKRNKASAMFEATISTAVSVMHALETQPFWVGLIMASIAGAMGIAQIATIASQSEPQYAKGGIFDTTGGVAKGPSHAEGGIGMYDEKTGQKVGEMEGGEAYMILSKKTTAANRDYINKLLKSSKSGSGERIAPDWVFAPPKQIDYTSAVETIEYTRHYRNGGVTQPAAQVPIKEKAPTGSSSSDQVLADVQAAIVALTKRLDQPVKAYMPWTDLEKNRKKYELLEKISSFGG